MSNKLSKRLLSEQLQLWYVTVLFSAALQAQNMSNRRVLVGFVCEGGALGILGLRGRGGIPL